MADKDDAAALQGLIGLLDEAAPDDPALLREELVAVGLDPVLVRARMATFAARPQAAELPLRTRPELVSVPAPEVDVDECSHEPTPLPWVRQEGDGWISDLAVASQQRDERAWVSLDFCEQGLGGGLRLGLFVSAGPGGDHALTVEWDAEFYHPPGWLLSLYRCGEERPFFRRNIGRGYRGSVILTRKLLGLDPAKTPLKFALDPDNHPFDG